MNYVKTPVRSALAIRRHAKGLCDTPRCRNKHRKGRWDCNSCCSRATRFRNPIKYVYHTLRTNAKRRGKDFSLTLEQFLSFIKDNNYMDARGRSKFSLSIDRDKNEFGYHAWNIKAITVSENSLKRNYIDYGDNKEKFEEAKKKLNYSVPEGEAF